MQIEFLGTGAGSPSKQRNVTSIALKLLEERNAIWLFDVGEATQHQILRTTIRPRKIEKISRSFQGGNEPLTIYGPRGIEDFVKVSLRVSETKLSYPLKFVELTDGGVIFKDKTFTVSCEKLDHKIECFGYRIVEHDHPGELKVEKLKEMNIPSGPVYGQLKAGKTVTLEDGTILDGHDFIGMPQKGRIVAILGDTRKNGNSIKLAHNADVLVHESTFAKGEGRMARNYYHSTSAQAAQIAKTANVGRLLLTHISARYTGRAAYELAYQVRDVFSATRVVNDLDVIDVPFRG